MTILVTLSAAGTSTTLFNLYSNLNYVTPLVTGITKAQLLAGYSLLNVPNNATTIRVGATGVCTNSVDLLISGLTTTTSTTSTTSTSTSTSTTTLPTTTTSTTSTTTTTTSPPLDCSFTVSAQEVETVIFEQELYSEVDTTLQGTLTVARPVRFKAFAELFNPGNAQITFNCNGFTRSIINNDEYTTAYSSLSPIVPAGTYTYEMIVNIAPDNGFTAGCGVTYEEAL